MDTGRFIGQPVPRIDAWEKVTGSAAFPGDLSTPGMAFMKTLFARRPHALIRRIDTTRARSAPGVIAVLTAADVPVNNYGIGIPDQPVLCADRVRFVGDRVALVVAGTPEQAERACRLIAVEYEDLPVLDSPAEALRAGAASLHPGKPDNVLAAFKVRKGNTGAGLARSDIVLSATYHMGAQEHAYLQPDAGIAWIDEEGRVAVKSAGQWPHDDRRQIARSLGLPEDRVRVIYTYAGGAFGGREDLTVQILLALAAYRTGRAVKAVWTREETTIGHPKRHPMTIRHTWGASREGRLIAQQVEIVADAGAYASTSDYVVATTVLCSTGPYDVPNVRVDAKAVYTNNPVGGAFRGFGAPQAGLAAEVHMARMAKALGMDSVAFRLRNFLRPDSLTGTMGAVPPGLSAAETLEAAALAAGWRRDGDDWRRPERESPAEVRPGVRRGIGIASGWKPVGYTMGWRDEATVAVELHGGAEVACAVVRAPVSEMGQGAHTVAVQMASELLGLPPERIELAPVDTASGASAGPASASRLTFMVGNALRGAVDAARQAWAEEERPARGEFTYQAPPTDALDPETGQSTGAFAFGYLAQAVEIELDEDTGQIGVRRLISAHDVGRAIHPQGVTGQIEGAAVQGLGWATMENFVAVGGQVRTAELSTYLIPTVLDIPGEVESIVLENDLVIGPWGATGIGEMPLVAVAPAVVAALHDATGVWMNCVPLTPEKVYQAIHSHT